MGEITIFPVARPVPSTTDVKINRRTTNIMKNCGRRRPIRMIMFHDWIYILFLWCVCAEEKQSGLNFSMGILKQYEARGGLHENVIGDKS